MNGECCTHVKRYVYTKFLQGHVKERIGFQDIGVDGGPILKWFLTDCDGSE